MRNVLLVLSVFIFVSSCKKGNDNNIIFGHEYFPYTEGHYVIYDVQDILHDDPVAVHDTSFYQIKEVIGEEDVDGEGETFRKMYRYYRANDTLNWSLKDVWVLKKTMKSVELVEENKRVIKLAFSISYDQYWDCNALNDKDAKQCYYSKIYEPIKVGQLDYDSSVVVEHQNFESYIEQLKEFEVYAPHVGMIQLYRKDITINNGDTLDVDRGTELYYTAVEFGQE